jgi:NhaA family Na+:H+ antiporter
MRNRVAPLKQFLHRESSSGVFLLVAAALGLGIANSPLSSQYFAVLEAGFTVGGGFFYLSLTTLKVINYILMTLFFFVVGLEIKRELTTGHLASIRSAIMPFIAAVGGMAVPASIYLLIAGRSDSRGWGVPVATDIALAVGLLGIVGPAVAPSLRSFLLGLAVIDDIGAILIIAFIYSTGVGIMWVLAACSVVLTIVLINRVGITHKIFYILLGISLWYFLYRSGVHSTLSGVMLGLLTPHQKLNRDLELSAAQENQTLIESLESKLHPWTSYVIVPIFAFANTGVVISTSALREALTSPIAWGIFCGLVIGKPLGVFASVLTSKKLGVGNFPDRASKGGVFATGSAAGIGFTVAIFIAHLAFREREIQELAIIAVIFASVVSGFVSFLLFKFLNFKETRLTG